MYATLLNPCQVCCCPYNFILWIALLSVQTALFSSPNPNNALLSQRPVCIYPGSFIFYPNNYFLPKETPCAVYINLNGLFICQTALLYSRNQNRTDEFYHLMCQNSFIIYQNYLNIFCRNSILYVIFVGTVLSLPFRRNNCILHPIFFLGLYLITGKL